MTRRRRGFSLIELVWAMTIIAILSGLVLPKLNDLIRRAKAVRITGDFDTVKFAVLSFYTDSLRYPPEVGAGVVPPGLASYLPTTFKWVKPDYTLDYDNWVLPSGLPKHPATQILIGLSIKTSDPKLGQMAMTLMGNQPKFTVGQKYTFIIVGM
jgi:prepilin-type N-terminal cleavage/methylation domain-containing protein